MPQPALQQKQSPLLLLPLELRLKIYSEVLNTHPIFHAHLAPPPQVPPPTQRLTNATMAEFHTAIDIKPLGHSLPSTCVLTRHSNTNAHPTTYRGKIPTGLLASCKLLYEETHLLPFEKNGFKFINWFWSGVYASRQFMKGLREWQLEGVRWVGVEVLTRDLTSNASAGGGNAEASRTDWMELCGLWKGVWGLKLGIKGSVSGMNGVNPLPVGGMMVEGLFSRPGELPHLGFETGENGLLSVDCDWVTKGLCEMKRLRWVEVEIEDKQVGREEKVLFCRELEEVLNSGERGWEGRVRVMFVEKTSVVGTGGGGSNKFMWFGGAPVGDDDG